MTKPLNVDICVTCVCEKPPKLPLREELPSLGIEVIYNAEGVGAEATEKELEKKKRKNKKKQAKEQQQQSQQKQERGRGRSRRNPPGRSALSPMVAKEDPPEDLSAMDIPQALSYSSYQRTLELRSDNNNRSMMAVPKIQKTDNPSVSSSLETSSSMDENDNMMNKKKKKKGKLFGLLRRKTQNTEPPTCVDIPNAKSQEEIALEEVFNAFLPDNDDDGGGDPIQEALNALSSSQEALNALSSSSPTKERSSTPSSNINDAFPDLLASYSNEDTKNKTDDDSSTVEVSEPTVSSIGEDSSFWKNKEIENDAAEFNNDLNEIAARALSPPQVKCGGSGGGNIKVKLLSNGSNITEMYDLTAISDDGDIYPQQQQHKGEEEEETFYSNDMSTVSGTIETDHYADEQLLTHFIAPTQHHFLSPTQRHFQEVFPEDIRKNTSYPHSQSDESSVPVPENDDEYGNLVLDMSNIFEEDGPGSPLVLSPIQERNTVNTFSFNSRGGTRSFDQKKIQNKYKLPSFDEDYHQRDVEFNENCDRRDDEICEGEGSLKNSSISRYPRLGIADPYRVSSSNHVNFGLSAVINRKPGMRIPTFDQAIASYYGARSSPASMPRIETTTATKAHHHTRFSPPSTNLIPSIRTSTSRDSTDTHTRLQSKVSFSEDIEERIFSNDEYDYDTSMADVKSSLAAIVHEERDFTEPLPSALSREAEEAFRSFADNLGMEDTDERSPEMMLLEALSYGDPLPFDFEETIKRSPDIATGRLPEIDAFALHTACLRAFPKRFAKDQTCRVNDLINDLALHQKLIGALIEANPETCRRVDVNGDLPVHILARHLMEWEAQWYQKVYDKARNDDDEPDNGSGITTLYKTMSECINALLQPISQDDSLCLQSGSIGRLLPLHIAAIFTVSYNTLRSIIEAFPNAASTKCELSDIRTFIPNHSTPLELHDRLSTDFPKWEIQRINSKPGEEMTQDMLDKVYGTTNGMRRSDLMFAFSPKILPYRKEAYRIRRMEQMIQNEMNHQDGSEDFSLTRAAEIFWVWICEFRNQDDIADHYAGSITRIIDLLPFHAVRYLASTLNEKGYPVIDRAMPLCVDAIMYRMRTISETKIPVPVQSLSKGLNSTVRSSILRQFDEDIADRFSLQGQGFIGPLCRTIFNITESAFPTSFVILPYKLVKDQEGRLGLESSNAAKVAMEFADYLSQLTSPKNIVHVLDQKIDHVLGRNITDTTKRESRESQRKRKEYFNQFLKLYENEMAYFYFIDDYTGVPIVGENNGIYPLVIRDAAEVVQKVFPLMLSGMILMRGAKSISILANVLLDDSIDFVLPHWIAAAKDMIGYLFSPCTELTESSLQGLLPLRGKLLNFVRRGSVDSEVSNMFYNGGLSSEWVVEVSLIKMVVEMHDKRHSYCGLLEQRAQSKVLWTQEPDFPYLDLKEYRKQIDFRSSKSLKVQLRRNGKYEYRKEKIKITTDTNDSTKYGQHFEDLALNKSNSNGSSSFYSGSSVSGSSVSGSSGSTDYSSEDEMPGMIITTTNSKHSRTEQNVRPARTTSRSNYKYSPSAEQGNTQQRRSATSQNYDNSLDLDDVLKLRIQLDEQEGKLELLRGKISDLQIAEDQLVKQEDKITDMIGEVVNQKDHIINSPTESGLTKARALLVRIGELEDRVLCREVEVGQLKNDVSCFELEASDRTESRRLENEVHNDDSSSFSHERGVSSVSRNSSDDEITCDEPDNYPVFNFNDVAGNDDESTVGNSTMYSSSIGGYSAGISSHS